MDANKTLTVKQAADRLGISKDAVRKRLERGTLRGQKDKSGRWQVFLSSQKSDQSEKSEFVSRELYEQLRAERDFLRQELERKDAVLYNLTRKMPALETEEQKNTRTRTPWYKKLFKS